MSLLPAQQPSVFSGKHFDYATFISAFESLIECQVSDSKQRLYYLGQFTSADAKESILGLITLNSPDSYDKARKVLKERFGHPYPVAQAYKDKLNAWPPVREGDGMHFQQFADFLVLSEQAMKTLMYMEGLNSEDALKRITLKLPSSVGVRWCHLANKMLKSEERLSMFHDVVKFVTQEASLATDPVFSPEALKEARKNEFNNTTNSSNSGRRVKSASSFSTNATPPEEQLPPSSSCRFCNSQHHSQENCSSFKRKTVKEKHLFKKQEYVSIVSATAICQDVETRRRAKLVVCPTQLFFMMKLRFLLSIALKIRQELFIQPKQLAAVQVPVMLLKPPIPSQILCLLQFEYTSMTTPNDNR